MVFKSYFQYFRGIEICIENKLTLPALTLIYSGIDIFSWVAYGDIGVKNRFTKWVENYMYTETRLAPSSIDLYAARCAILHTLTPDSDLSRNNEALPIYYAYGNADLKELERSIEYLGLNGQISCVHLNDLFESFKLGVVKLLESEGESLCCKKRMSKHYSHLGKSIIEAFNEYVEKVQTEHSKE